MLNIHTQTEKEIEKDLVVTQIIQKIILTAYSLCIV